MGDGANTLFWFDHCVGEMSLRFNFPRLFDLAVNKVCTVAEMDREGWEEGGRGWSWGRRLFAWEEDSLRECTVLLNNIGLQANVSDKWRWTLDTIHGYSVREAYRLLTSYGNQVDRSRDDNVWHKHIPSKVSMFVWHLLRNRFPTRDNLMCRNVLHLTTSSCAAGYDDLETANHLFLACGTSLNLWFSVLPIEIRDHQLHFCYMAELLSCTHSFLQGIWYASVWVLWKNQNNCVFKNEADSASVLLEKVKRTSFLWLKAKHISFNFSYYDWWKHALLCIGVYP